MIKPGAYTMSLKPFLAAATLLAATLPAAEAAGLPVRARIVYQASLSGLPVGEAVQQWVLDKQHYRLETEVTPIFGPKIRYLSNGEVTDGGLKPADYAEFRGKGDSPRQQARFDWGSHQVSYGAPESPQSGKLEAGAQDYNTLPFQLAWLGKKPNASLQIVTGRKLRQDKLVQAEAGSISLMGKNTPTRIWRTQDVEEGSEIWLAPEYGGLPVKIVRHDDKGEQLLVAKSIEYQQE